jgi:arabinan endo-1,5-alpha-L-arabinosidase
MGRHCVSMQTTIGLLGVAAAAFGMGGRQPANAIKDVHDPALIREGDVYYLFSTGKGVPIRRSRDLIHWEFVGQAFPDDVPAGAKQEIPNSAMVWAPTVSFFNGRYHLYYAVSTFGSNRSLIGLATNKTLDPARPDYRWSDEGKVIESTKQDSYNAIDPNILLLPHHRAALTFGSFWSGIRMVPLDLATGKPAAGAAPIPLARRPPPDALEAPFLLRHGKYYYLFVSFDFCCRGVRSTYNIRVGRSEQAAGPYVDRDGKSLMEGGGTLLLGTQGRVIGPGHCAVLKDRKADYLAYHFYDGDDNGKPTLQLRPLTWSPDGWPATGEPLHE